MFIAIGLLLPFITMQIPEVGNMLCPMHFPILLCGLICGPWYGLAVGFITPLLRSALFTMPPLFPGAVGMAFELAAYGLCIGIIYSLFKKKNLAAIYVSLIVSMIVGRIVWGIARLVMYGIDSEAAPFGFSVFIADGFTKAVPGIILQLILIPAIMQALNVSGVLKEK